MRHKNETRPAYEMRKEHIAIAAMVLQIGRASCRERVCLYV